MTITDLIKDALNLIGVIAADETPTASDQQSCLRALTRMIGSWSNENLMLYRLSREVFELVPGQYIYTVGDGGDFDTTRPMSVVGAASGPLIKTPIYDPLDPEVITGYDLKVDLEIPMEVQSYQKWMGTTLKTTSSTIATRLYVEGTSPLETFHIYMVPSQQYGLVVYALKELVIGDDLNVDLGLPPGYDDALVNNLAVKICPLFARPVSAELDRDARMSKGNIKTKNSRVILSTSDAFRLNSDRRSFNILSGDS
jgi:hypothetical protein